MRTAVEWYAVAQVSRSGHFHLSFPSRVASHLPLLSVDRPAPLYRLEYFVTVCRIKSIFWKQSDSNFGDDDSCSLGRADRLENFEGNAIRIVAERAKFSGTIAATSARREIRVNEALRAFLRFLTTAKGKHSNSILRSAETREIFVTLSTGHRLLHPPIRETFPGTPKASRRYTMRTVTVVDSRGAIRRGSRVTLWVIQLIMRWNMKKMDSHNLCLLICKFVVHKVQLLVDCNNFNHSLVCRIFASITRIINWKTLEYLLRNTTGGGLFAMYF